ncbi:restriction endonuclease subunit S [Brevundimonas vesicularis]|uniref:restriction endonuclease subunit S n=1 Tax=Brevundimonas vesicularis TaxID=41276 RepID=UPI0022EC556C|nr:restriction endonuclease subunit S [Brevundimonas vesicularis]WBT05683.1 restriction endonuclease subunit S [Brevundimonas vesicularis]
MAQYERIADAPEAIARLRRLILDLAVRGKLVPQDATDEPVRELLTRIAKEKSRLAKAREIRKPKAIPALPETPFPIPSNWCWSQLAEIGVLSPRNEAPDTLEASFVPMPLIAAEYGVANQHEVRPWGEIKKGYTHFAEGDVGLAKITPCFENGKSAVFRNLTGGIGSGTTELHIVRPLFVDQDFILIFLKSPHFVQTGIPKMTGTAGQKRVPTEYFAHSPFPLPPLAEQQRIVAKVNELMCLCDRLEAAQEGREIVRDRLTAASLECLSAPDADSFQANARFALDALPSLAKRPDQIKAWRQAILNLAVRGRLVPQDVNDEPASALLERLHGERTHKRKFAQIVEDDLEEPLPELPSGWLWTTPDQISADDESAITDGPFGSQLKTDHYIQASGFRVIRLQNVGAGSFREEHHSFIEKSRYERLSKHHIHAGDLVVAGLVDPSVRCCEVPANIGPALVKADCYRFAVHPKLSSRYALHCLNSQLTQRFAAAHHHGMTLTRIGLGNFRRIPVPLPPLAEQHRIVARVDELMVLCDRLEASLATSTTTRRRLLDALLAEAVDPSPLAEAA